MDYIRNYGTLWDEWIPVERIGKGQYGTVYRAENIHDASKLCAVKLISVEKQFLGIESDETIRSDKLQNAVEQIVQKELREINLMEMLRDSEYIVTIMKHLIIPKIHTIDILLQMELLTSLGKQIKQKLPERSQILKLGLDLSQALVACEEHGIVHRDIKPDNIFVDKNGTYKLGDFGLSRTLEVSSSLSRSLKGQRGTPQYMAPESWRFGNLVTCQTDQYALGIVLYQLLNDGKIPFCDDMDDYENVNNAINQRLSGKELPPPVNENGELWQIIKKACSHIESNRYHSALEFNKALQELAKKEESLRLIPLTEYLHNPVLPKKSILKMAIHLCQGLSELWQSEAIHGAIHPDLILVNADGDCKLKLAYVDSGKPLQNAPEYMAPECFNPYRKASCQTDQYALGIILYQLLNNGRIPFWEDSKEPSLAQALERRYSGEELPPPANENGAFWEVIKKTCSLNESERYASPNEIEAALHDLVETDTKAEPIFYTLSEYMKQQLPDSSAAALLGEHLCDELIRYEEEGKIHCAITPDCIYVNEAMDCLILGPQDNFCLQTDLKERRKAREMTGYMAPEGFTPGKRISHQTDQYAVGIILYQLLNDGKLPFCSDMNNPEDVEESIYLKLECEELPPPWSESGELWKIIQKACELNERNRFQNAQEMKQALHPLVTAQKASIFQPLSEYRKQHSFGYEQVKALGIQLCTKLLELEKNQLIHGEISLDKVLVNENAECRLDPSDEYCMENNTKSRRKNRNVTVYMAPEGFTWGKMISYKTDQYAVGILLYQLLNQGNAPFCSTMDDPEQCLQSIERKLDEEELPPPKGNKGELWQIIQKACELDEHKRYQNPKEMLLALQNLPEQENPLQSSVRQSNNQTNHTLPTIMAQTDNNWSHTRLFNMFDVRHIQKVYFFNTINTAPVRATDLSVVKDRSVLGWQEGSNLYIAGNGGVKANKYSSRLFNYCENLKSIEFNNCFDTSDVVDMSYMFYGCSQLRDLDLSSFKTEKITDMRLMFYGCTHLTSLNLSGWNPPKTANKDLMFQFCPAKNKLDDN